MKAHFTVDVLPKLRRNGFDTGKQRLVLRDISRLMSRVARGDGARARTRPPDYIR